MRQPFAPDLLEGVLLILREAHFGTGLSVQSNLARALSGAVAAAASERLITTRYPDGFGRRWVVTPRGLTFLNRES